MEDLANQLGGILLKKKQIEMKWDAEIDEIKERLCLILFQSPSKSSDGSLESSANISTTPQQIKKRAKRISSLDVCEEEINQSPKVSEIENKSSDTASESFSSATQNATSLESIEPQKGGRPTRAAKLKTENLLKEPSLITKLRQPNILDGSLNKNNTKTSIAKEKSDNAEIVETEKLISSNNELINIQTLNKSNDEEMQMADDCVQIVTKPPMVEIFSDNETEKMPPPMAPPKKKVTRSNRNKTANIEMERRPIKKEKMSLNPSVSIDTTNHDVQMLEESTVTIKKEKDTDDSSIASNGKRGRKPKNLLKHQPIKEERLSEVSPPEVVETTQRMTTRSSKEKKSTESVYEDALCNNEAISSDHDKNVALASFASADTQKNDDHFEKPATYETFSNQENNESSAKDATFVSNAQDKGSAPKDATYVSSPERGTFIIENNANDTVVISANDNKQQTFCVANSTFEVNPKQQNQKESIMTDDESFEIPEIPFKPIKTNKNKKELFNPCVQSPVKKKVEAFEKVAANSSSPPQRQTRTKTRAKKKENVEPENMVIRELKYSASTSSATTPTALTRTGHLGRFLTPTQQMASNTPLINSGAIKKMPNSASKIQAFPTKAGTSVYKSSSSSSIVTLSREQSAEDLKRGITKLQQLADERKKKREQKQQQAAQTREAKEKERTDRLKKQIEEREKKCRKAHEADARKRELEDIDRNLKMQEEKRETAKRIEKEKLRQRAAVEEAARKEKEMLEKMRIQKQKNEIKMQLQQQQKELILKKQKQLMPKYDFDMLNSDDSTDEEGKVSHKRPPVPTWSSRANRGSFITCQSYLPSKIIDSFFSVQPMTPDLKQIFPAIDPRYLKRNSSAIWRTPPRYSEMPKY